MVSENFYRFLLDQVEDGIYFVDPRRRITDWNRASERITGYKRERVVGQFCMANILMHVDEQGNQLCLNGCPLAATLADRQPRETQVYLHHADGHRVLVNVKVMPVIVNGEVTGAVEIFHENTPLSTALNRVEELEQAAMLDDLTQIGNRRMLQLRLELAMQSWEQRQHSFGVLFVDVDHFKQVNDVFGHPTGDRVLQMAARSLNSGLRAYDWIGRWGGEEFLAIVPLIEGRGLGRVAERLRMLVERSDLPIEEAGSGKVRSIQVTVSIGGAVIRPTETLTSLLARADMALYQAKRNGRNKVVFAE